MLPLSNNDDRIISTAIVIERKAENNRPVILVSKDTSVRIKADTHNLTTQDYLTDKTTVFRRFGNITEGDDPGEIRSVRYLKAEAEVFRVYGENNMQIIRRQCSAMSIMPKNIEQECAIDALSPTAWISLRSPAEPAPARRSLPLPQASISAPRPHIRFRLII
jgi:predicted ribonuclease YlaK